MSHEEEIAEVFDALAKPMVEERRRFPDIDARELGPPVLRAKGGTLRPIVVEGKDGSRRTVTHGDVVQGLLKREGVEVAAEGKRPRAVACIACARLRKVPKNGPLPKWCAKCERARNREPRTGAVARTATWRQKNPEKHREHKRKYREKKRAEKAANG